MQWRVQHLVGYSNSLGINFLSCGDITIGSGPDEDSAVVLIDHPGLEGSLTDVRAWVK
ncbi:MAG: hypothetical protein GF401_05055 [Chitinivibrionales bacterium]|nr:hypothetical protein [Chitinivibrionales bacterium]